ncbi:hypothetical protein J6590_035267 [Homalodisca vitripennis]|nr:hypothetical protein J6590_035267 [Homalodisca vitripennis]
MVVVSPPRWGPRFNQSLVCTQNITHSSEYRSHRQINMGPGFRTSHVILVVVTVATAFVICRNCVATTAGWIAEKSPQNPRTIYNVRTISTIATFLRYLFYDTITHPLLGNGVAMGERVRDGSTRRCVPEQQNDHCAQDCCSSSSDDHLENVHFYPAGESETGLSPSVERIRTEAVTGGFSKPIYRRPGRPARHH